ncbi:MAG: gliding motility lipoprotein GldD [Bacteroidales bacterium]|nr:gliding motility lipoprotein GldD [Bacteroidales bacterium]
MYRIGIVLIVFILMACSHNYHPKPLGYFRIDLPKKEYQVLQSSCPYSFEYPVYGEIDNYKGVSSEPCWININFPEFKGKIYITYKPVEHNLEELSEDIRTIVYKHLIKADDIIENIIDIPERNVYGILYDIKGNTASSVNFYITDSTAHFISGSLYFNVRPNADSLAPVIEFFREDINHLIETTSWK